MDRRRPYAPIYPPADDYRATWRHGMDRSESRPGRSGRRRPRLSRRSRRSRVEVTRYDCCVPCHLSWEERHVFGFLPPEHRDWIRDEHAVMRQYRRKYGDWPREYLARHAAAEDPVFSYYLPEPMLRRMKYEHEVLEWKAKNGLPLDD